ncbi:MAG: acetate/propionate family kinase [Lautropia sp.]|nr:acetate/propionate family kinase [Lautropia sp.]
MSTTFEASAVQSKRADGLILVLNCGSSSIKFALYDASQQPLPRHPVWSGKVQGIGGPNATYGDTETETQALMADERRPYLSALEHIRERVEARLGGRKLEVVVHRVVHGGDKYSRPVRIDEQVLADLESYIPLAPLHQPYALEAIAALLKINPDLPQVACFDTAFHHTMPKVEKQLPLPYTVWERGLRRYGFHGLSYEYLSLALPERFGKQAEGKLIAAHLGSGASLCAMRGLKSQATSMGFSALDGLMMGTRPGALDPGAVLYLMEMEKLSVKDMARVLYHESGLMGVSGLSPEPRVLLAHEKDESAVGERARDALALYIRRIVREIGSMVAAQNGVDMIVFTAGVGENSAEVRRRIVAGLGFLGARLDDQANEANASVISTPDSAVLLAVEPTNEEWVAARHASRVMGLIGTDAGGMTHGDGPVLAAKAA